MTNVVLLNETFLAYVIAREVLAETTRKKKNIRLLQLGLPLSHKVSNLFNLEFVS